MTVDERAASVNEGFDASTRAQALARYYDLDVADVAYDAELYQELAQQAAGHAQASEGARAADRRARGLGFVRKGPSCHREAIVGAGEARGVEHTGRI